MWSDKLSLIPASPEPSVQVLLDLSPIIKGVDIICDRQLELELHTITVNALPFTSALIQLHRLLLSQPLP
jgi:hypothetical protein